MAVDALGSAFVTGSSFSNNFPTLNAYQSSCSSTCSTLTDAVVAKLSPAGTALVYSTYLGGAGEDDATGIGVDALGNARGASRRTGDRRCTSAGPRAVRLGACRCGS